MLLVSFLIDVILHISPGLLLPKVGVQQHSTNMRKGEKQPQEHQNPSSILLELYHSSLPLCKNNKKPYVDTKIQTCETFTLTEGFVFSSCRCSKQSVSRLLTLSQSEHLIRYGCFQICSVETMIHQYYCMLTKSFI